MMKYIKMIILAIFSGFSAPLPVSSSAHFNFFANVLNISESEEVLSFYFNVFMVVFSLVLVFSLRKIYLSVVKSLFVSKKDGEIPKKTASYKRICKNILLSLLPTLLLVLPVFKGKSLYDIADNFYGKNSLILTGAASVITALILVVSLWYTRQNNGQLKRNSDRRTVLRFSIYQLPCYIIPGFSHVASGASNLLISDVSSKVIVRDIYLYFAPSLFLVSFIKMLKCIFSGVVVEPIVLILGIVFFCAASKIVVDTCAKVNIRRLFAIFSVYSFLFGVFIAVAAFFI
ncbi:MAG: undecaprenyl-diphosphate phosphatase [Acutalibacteraceae bacterium]